MVNAQRKLLLFGNFVIELILTEAMTRHELDLNLFLGAGQARLSSAIASQEL